MVYKAVRRDHGVESRAAIKVISIPSDPSEIDSLRAEGLDINASKTYLQSIVNDFVSEIQLMESLKGVQNIVSVEDYNVVEKTAELGWEIYIRMELLTPFNAYICDKKLTEEEVIKLGCDICTALEICAKRNIIHRDIKPENIFINDFGHFKLGDFGIARKMENLTAGLSQKGSPNYMAPEVAHSSEYDARVDTYSLGIVLYRLLNGNRLPFLDTEKQVLSPNERGNALNRRMRGEALPAPCDASPAMADLILRACAYDPDMRFASATEMKQALLSVANGTYQIPANDLDKTTSVRRALDDYDKTTSVRKVPAPSVSNQKKALTASAVGAAPKKKSKLPAVLVAVLAAVLLVGVGIFAVPKLIGNNGTADGEGVTDVTSNTEADEPVTPGDTADNESDVTETYPVHVVEDPDRIVSVDVSFSHIVAVYADGTVDAVYLDDCFYLNNRSELLQWRDIVAVSAGNQHTVGLKSDGTVVAAGENFDGECDVSDWTDIVQVAAGFCFTAGLKKDGTVVYAGNPPTSESYDVSDLTDVVAIDASDEALDCLLSDGTWIRRGDLGGGQWRISEKMYTSVDVAADENGYISHSSNIVDISTGLACSIGLKSDGTVQLVHNLKLEGYTGPHLPDRFNPKVFDTSSWRNIVDVGAGNDHVVGLREDGAVVFTGSLNPRYAHHYDMSDWSDISEIYAGGEFTIGLTKEGTLLAAGMTYIADAEEWERLDVSALNRKTTAKNDTSHNDMYPNHATDAEGIVLIDNSNMPQDELCLLGYKFSNGLEIQNPDCYSNDSNESTALRISFTWEDNNEIT